VREVTRCIFHDTNYLKGNNYEKNKEEVGNRFKRKLSKYRSNNMTFEFFGYCLPEISFKNEKFTETLYLVDAIFYGETSFKSATFSGVVSFTSVNFKSSAKFNNTNFLEKGDFHSATFLGQSDFAGTTFKRVICFSYYVSNIPSSSHVNNIWYIISNR
jgi:Pentapeptide repeats (9 copies)